MIFFYHSYLLWFIFIFTTTIWLLCLHFTTVICYELLLQLFDCCAFILPQLFSMTFTSVICWAFLPRVFPGPFDHSYLLGLLTTAICYDILPQLFDCCALILPVICYAFLPHVFLCLHFTTAICCDRLPQLFDCCTFILPQPFAMTFYHSYWIAVPSFYHSYLLWHFCHSCLLCLYPTLCLSPHLSAVSFHHLCFLCLSSQLFVAPFCHNCLFTTSIFCPFIEAVYCAFCVG